MAKKIIKAQMKQRRDTFANWAAENPVLLDGELGIVSDDPNLYKVGDGASAWNALPFRGFDGTLAQELGTSPNAVISQKVVSEKLSELSERINNLPQGDKFDKQGNYPLLHVGTADDLAGRGESVPASFGFRASGGKSIKDGRAYIKRIKGNSVVWNQLLPNSTNIVTSSGTKALNEGTRIVAGHKYLLFADFDGGTAYAGVSLFARVNGESKSIFALGNNESKTYKFVTAEIGGVSDGTGATVEGNIWQYFYFLGTTESITNTRLIDLTQMFQAGNEPTTIEEFYARVATLGVDLNAYNEGEVIHCNTESIKSVGDNAWDEEWERGDINLTTGVKMESNDYLRTKNYIDILPNCEYAVKGVSVGRLLYYDADLQFIGKSDSFLATTIKTFLTPANARYMMYRWEGATYNHDIMITLVHSGWKQDTDAGYQPYWQDILPLPIIRKYFPDGMKSTGIAHDEVRFNKASGKWEYSKGKIKSVDMGDMAWGYNSDNQVFSSYTLMDLMTHPTELSERAKGLLCSKYSPSRTYVAQTMDDKSWLRIPKSVTIKDTSYTDAATFKAALSGVILYYESNDCEWVELDADDQNFRDYYNVADFGTEQSQSEVPSAPFSADIIYQFNAVDMIREHEIEITELQKVIATMQAQLTSLTNGVA